MRQKVSGLFLSTSNVEQPGLTDQGYHTLMNLTRNNVVQALMRTLVIVEGEVALEPSLQIRHCGVVA